MAWAVVIKNPLSVSDKDTGMLFSGITGWYTNRSEAEARFSDVCEKHPGFEVSLVRYDLIRSPIED